MPTASHDIVTEDNFYRSLFENAAAGIGRTDWDSGRVLIANARLAEIFGYDNRDEFIRDFIFAEHYPDEGGRQRQLEFYQQRPGKLVEAVFTRKDESLVYVEAEVRIDIEQGFIDFVIIDISERLAAELALQESIEAKSEAENLLQTMIEHSPIPISVKDLSGRYLYLSHAYKDYLNSSVDEVLGRRSVDIQEVEVSDEIRNADEQVVATGMPLEADQSFAVTLGQSTLQVSKFPIFDTNGDVSGIATIGVDITELEATRQELDKRSSLLEESEKIAQLGHWQWDEVSHELIFCSRQAASIFNLTPEQMLAQVNTHEKQLAFVHPEDRDLVTREVWAFIDYTSEYPDDAYSITFEYRLLLADNNIRYLRETMGVELDAHGQRVRSVGTIQDVTELMRARNELQQHRDQLELLVAQRNEELRESEEVFRSFYEVIPDISMITGLEDGIVKNVNKGFTDTTGYGRDEIIGQSTLNLDLWRDNADRDRLVAELRQTGKVRNLDAEFRKKDGSFWPGIMAACIVQLDGKPHILSTTKDISELHRVQDMAIKANQAKSQFLSSMSHELRTPLNAILGFTQVLQMSDNLELPDRQQKAFRTIRKSGEHLLQLINRILELSRIEAGDLEIDLCSTEPIPLIAESIEMVAGVSQLKSINLVNETVDLDLPLVHTDAIRTRQILLNLLSNAIKYNYENGSVTVQAKVVRGAGLRISIIDTGHGFGEDKHLRIFEPFDRLDEPDSETASAGIGLSIAKQLIEAIGGAIGFSSEPGVGSHFWIDLPLCDASEHSVIASQEPATASVSGDKLPIISAPRRILYIEDNLTNFELMQEIFEDVENAELLHTLDAESGIDLATANPPDLILMDISLPGMDGIEATKILKSLPQTSAIPVIGISAAALTDDIERARGVGFHAYQTKPFQINEFLGTLRAIMNEVSD